jgi:CRISPR-associated protein Cmr5
MSLQLDYMKQALADVQDVRGNHDEKIWKPYGALCHQIPIFVLTNGLALTAAFVDAKAGASQPFTLVRGHMIHALGGGANTLTGVLDRTNRADDQYMLDTFTILDAWVYYKRFAVSILDVEPGTVDDALESQAGDV